MSNSLKIITSISLGLLLAGAFVMFGSLIADTAFGQGTITRLNSGMAYVRDAYSDRFDEQITVNTVTEALDAIFEFTYVAPSITLAGTPGTSVREFGNPITSQALSATTVRRSNPITAVAFYRGATLIDYDDSPAASGGVETYTDTDSVGVTSSWSARAADGTATTTSNSLTVTFVYPFYWGVGAQSLTAAQVALLTKSVTVQGDKAVTTSPTNEVYYFAYPKSYGLLDSILDENSFETIGDYTIRDEPITGLSGSPVDYYIYEFNNLTTQVNFTNTYKF